ncbi:MAG: 2-amino-4-hydroxy-6-hydroxymethyldihydropteridine diphosphokinase [Spongiibacteraceae bacterium]
MSKGVRCFIGLGSNLGEPAAQIKSALAAINGIENSQLGAVSPHYRNPAIGPGQQPDYLNAVAELYTTLDSLTLLSHLQQIETAQGRVRTERWGARTLDLDLLLYGDAIIDLPQLQVPHPRLHERNFVLYPLHDIAPYLTLPRGASLRSLLDCCSGAGLTRL